MIFDSVCVSLMGCLISNFLFQDTVYLVWLMKILIVMDKESILHLLCEGQIVEVYWKCRCYK